MGIYNWHLSRETATLWEEDIYVNPGRTSRASTETIRCSLSQWFCSILNAEGKPAQAMMNVVGSRLAIRGERDEL